MVIVQIAGDAPAFLLLSGEELCHQLLKLDPVGLKLELMLPQRFLDLLAPGDIFECDPEPFPLALPVLDGSRLDCGEEYPSVRLPHPQITGTGRIIVQRYEGRGEPHLRR